MQLFFAPFACSLASHIVCREAGVDVDLQRVDLMSKALADGGSFYDVNPRGQVPTLRLDDGAVLTEGTAVLQYLADLAPGDALAPKAGTPGRYRVMEWLGYIATELHKNILWQVFSPATGDEAKELARGLATGKLDYLSEALGDRKTLVGDSFTAADAYLLWWLLIAPRAGIDLAPYPTLLTYRDRHAARPQVQAAIAAEQALMAA